MGRDRRSGRAYDHGAGRGRDAGGPRDLRRAGDRLAAARSLNGGGGSAERGGRDRSVAGTALQSGSDHQLQAKGVLVEEKGRRAVQGLARGRARADASLRGSGQRDRREPLPAPGLAAADYQWATPEEQSETAERDEPEEAAAGGVGRTEPATRLETMLTTFMADQKAQARKMEARMERKFAEFETRLEREAAGPARSSRRDPAGGLLSSVALDVDDAESESMWDDAAARRPGNDPTSVRSKISGRKLVGAK